MPSKSSKHLSHLGDDELLLEFQNSGDLAILGVLYKRYMHLIFGICFKYLKNKADCEDAVMQIFEKLIKDVPRFKIDNFKSWLHVTTRNFCLMQIRAQKNKEGITDSIENMEFSLPTHHNNESSIEGDLVAMEKCIEKLIPEQQQCVNLFFLQERSYRQIVEIAGYELKKVKSYIQNGKRNIKICLEKKGE